MLNKSKIKSFLFKKHYKVLYEDRKLSSATFEILNACNFKCVHCYNQNLAIKFMPLTDALKIIDELCMLGCKNITLTGGETTMHPQFEKIYKYCFDKGLKITLYTNGYYINKFLNFLKKYPPLNIDISLYGMNDKTYKEICHIKDGFSVISNNINLILSNGLPITLKSVIMQQNCDQFDQINAYCTKLNIPFRFDLNLLTSKDFVNKQEDNSLTDDKYFQVMNQIRKHKLNNWMGYITRENVFNDSDALYSCGAGRISLFINCNGGVRICNFAEFSEKNFNDTSLEKIWESFKEYLVLDKDKKGDCYNCKYKKFCSNCPVTTYMAHKTDGKSILPVAQNCREAKYIYNSVNNE